MKKLVFVVVLALVGFSCFAQQGIEGLHNLFNSCDAYAGEEYTLYFMGKKNTIEEAQSWVNEGLYNSNVNIKQAKPFKNEAEVAFEVVQKYYTPEKGDMYLVITNVGSEGRFVVIWIEKNQYYNYWIFSAQRNN